MKNNNGKIKNNETPEKGLIREIKEEIGLDLDGNCLAPLSFSTHKYDNSIYITNHGPKGGDFFGEVVKGTNYGWMDVAWGGTDYDGSIIGCLLYTSDAADE